MSEIDPYYKLVKDKNIYKLPPEEAKAYAFMRLRQQGKPIPKSSMAPITPKDIISQAYLESLCFRKKIYPTQPLQLNQTLKDHIHTLYLSGALPMRLGGVDE
jgi:hypothetical protein